MSVTSLLKTAWIYTHYITTTEQSLVLNSKLYTVQNRILSLKNCFLLVRISFCVYSRSIFLRLSNWKCRSKCKCEESSSAAVCTTDVRDTVKRLRGWQIISWSGSRGYTMLTRRIASDFYESLYRTDGGRTCASPVPSKRRRRSAFSVHLRVRFLGKVAGGW